MTNKWSQTKEQIDEIVSKFPIFITTSRDEPNEYITSYPKGYVGDSSSDNEAEYKSHLVDQQMCVVYTPKLFELLNKHGIDTTELKKELYSALNPSDPPQSSFVQYIQRANELTHH